MSTLIDKERRVKRSNLMKQIAEVSAKITHYENQLGHTYSAYEVVSSSWDVSEEADKRAIAKLTGRLIVLYRELDRI